MSNSARSCCRRSASHSSATLCRKRCSTRSTDLRERRQNAVLALVHPHQVVAVARRERPEPRALGGCLQRLSNFDAEAGLEVLAREQRERRRARTARRPGTWPASGASRPALEPLQQRRGPLLRSRRPLEPVHRHVRDAQSARAARTARGLAARYSSTIAVIRLPRQHDRPDEPPGAVDENPTHHQVAVWRPRLRLPRPRRSESERGSCGVRLDEARDLGQPPLCHRLLVHPEPERVLVEDLLVHERSRGAPPIPPLAAGGRSSRPGTSAARRRGGDAGMTMRGRSREPRSAPEQRAPEERAPISAMWSAGARSRLTAGAVPDRRRPGALLDHRLHEREGRLVAAARRAALRVGLQERVGRARTSRSRSLLALVQVERIDADPHRGTRGCCSGTRASRARARSRRRARSG